DDVPVGGDGGVEVGGVAGEAAVRLAEPVAHGAGVVAPQDVADAVAVEIAGADDVPVAGHGGVEVGGVAGKAAVRLAEPVAHRAGVVAPQDVDQPVAVEVAGPDNVPVARYRRVEVG